VLVYLWISIAPAGQDAELAYADAFFNQKEYDKAARHYGWFVKKYRIGPRVGMASYRLGTINLNANDYAAATVNFELASREADSPEIRYQAKYFNARCLQLIQKEDLALSLYDQLIRSNPGPETNHFKEKSILETARIQAARGENEKAQQHFKTLIDSATTNTVREEAIVRSGLVSVESGKIEQGEITLKHAGKFGKDSPWKSLAEVGALSIAYAKKDYDRVVSIYSSGTILSSAGEYRPRVLVMVADAFRAKGDNKAAARLYTLVEARYPNTESGVEAGYRKLTIIYKSNKGSLPTEVEKYATKLRLRDVNHVYIDKAYLLLGEWHFFQAEKGIQRKDGKYANDQYRLAAETYLKIRDVNIAAELVPTMLFHQSWAGLEAGDVIAGAQ
jgi:tetratricopeptide (TPR) repeat protein